MLFGDFRFWLLPSNGADGAVGANGADGADGANGADGADGANGADGTDGADGADAKIAVREFNLLLKVKIWYFYSSETVRASAQINVRHL